MTQPINRAGQEVFYGMLWLAGCCVASALAMGYEFRPGALGPSTTSWPADSAMTRSSQTNTIVAFLHPRCTCSRATVKQLLRTVAAHPNATLLVQVFVPPKPAEQHGWVDGEYARMIRAAVPHARIVPDQGGVEAKRFGALTSGTMLVYDSRGTEIFRGGITNRRGGEDDNPGLRHFTKVLSGGEGIAHADPSPVFGCPLVINEQHS